MDFDNKIREIIENASVAPDDKVWENISAVMRKRALRLRYFKRVAYTSFAAAAVLILFIVLDTNVKENLIISVHPDKVTSIAVVKEKKERLISKVKVRNTTAHSNNKGIDDNKSTTNIIAELTIDDNPSNIALTNPVKSDLSEQTHPVKVTEKKQLLEEEPYLNSTVKQRFKISIFSYLTSASKKTRDYMFTQILNANGTTSSPAQTYYIQSDARYFTPTTLGLQFQFPVSQKFSIGSGLVYSYVRSEIKTSTMTGGEYTVVQQLHYLGIPLNAYYNVVSNEKVKFYVNLGCIVEKGINKTIKVINAGNANSRFSESIDPLALSMNVGMGAEYMLSSHTGIYLDPSLAYFFNTKQPVSIRTVEPLQFKFELGVRLHL